MSLLSKFTPQPLWNYFDQILKIPRGSGNEQEMREYMISEAKRFNCTHKVDAAGNLVIQKPGSAGHENSPTIVLQGHLDMVNEKNSDVEHDFDKDPLIPQQDGDYIKATGTTLGADNGIALATMLAMMASTDIPHGPLEMLCTVDEETGLTGASDLADDMLEGRILLNLDSEAEGELTIGCAGGGDSQLNLPIEDQATPDNTSTLSIRLYGLKGGHSGLDINLQRGNAIKMIARGLYAVSLEKTFLVSGLRGGSKHNAIPREAWAEIVIPGSTADAQAVREAFEAQIKMIHGEFRTAAPDLQLEIKPADTPDRVWTPASTAKVLQLLMALPHGVESMSYEIASLVETSTNLAIVTDDKPGNMHILTSTRSSVGSAFDALRERIRAIGMMAGATVEEEMAYPGWQPNTDSKLLTLVKQIHKDVLGTDPGVVALHAGLECGIIGEKFEGMDMISFGPTIEFPHSPDERIKIGTVDNFYKLLTAILKKLA
jgi:dipeptidase D